MQKFALLYEFAKIRPSIFCMTKSNSPLCMKRFDFDWFSSADLGVLKQFLLTNLKY